MAMVSVEGDVALVADSLGLRLYQCAQYALMCGSCALACCLQAGNLHRALESRRHARPVPGCMRLHMASWLVASALFAVYTAHSLAFWRPRGELRLSGGAVFALGCLADTSMMSVTLCMSAVLLERCWLVGAPLRQSPVGWRCTLPVVLCISTGVLLLTMAVELPVDRVTREWSLEAGW